MLKKIRNNNKLPAILSGEPAFQEPISFNKPTLPHSKSIFTYFTKIMRSGLITKGPVLTQYEIAIENYLNVKEAVAVSSCTTGLMLVLQALKLRVGKLNEQWEVILPSFTFPATAHACIWNNLIPVYADCNPGTYLLDPKSAEDAVSSRTIAILAVHTFGNPVEIDPLLEIAKKYSLFLLFDAAHGFGSLQNGKPVGGNGIAEVFSTSPTKLLATGEGGIVATNDAELAEHVRIAREYGNPGDYHCYFPGMNGRLSEFHALLGLEGLKDLPVNAERRRTLASVYKEILCKIPGIKFQIITNGALSSFKDVAILIGPEFGINRDQLRIALKHEGIPTRTYFDPPLHLQVFSKGVCRSLGPLNNTELVASQVLCLPIASHFPLKHVRKIAMAIKKIYLNRSKIADCSLLDSRLLPSSSG